MFGIDGFDTWDPSFLGTQIQGMVAVVIGPDYWDRVGDAVPRDHHGAGHRPPRSSADSDRLDGHIRDELAEELAKVDLGRRSR